VHFLEITAKMKNQLGIFLFFVSALYTYKIAGNFRFRKGYFLELIHAYSGRNSTPDLNEIATAKEIKSPEQFLTRYASPTLPPF